MNNLSSYVRQNVDSTDASISILHLDVHVRFIYSKNRVTAAGEQCVVPKRD